MRVISEYGAVSMQRFHHLSHMKIHDFVIYLKSESKILQCLHLGLTVLVTIDVKRSGSTRGHNECVIFK